MDLKWTEEDELAYRDAANSMSVADDFMDDDDLLEDDLNELKEPNPLSVNGQPRSNLPVHISLGRPKVKGRKKDPKKDPKKKDIKSKSNLGPSDLKAAASKKLLLLHRRFSPKGPGAPPMPTKPSRTKHPSNPPTRQVSSPSSQGPTSLDCVGKGESSSPPGTDK